MKNVKVAVIGYGHLGRWHAQKADGIETANLVAIVESYPENQKKARLAHPNIKIVSSIEEVIGEIDAAVIVTPTSTHHKLTKYLLENKKHVFCEKPLCSTHAEALELADYVGDLTLQVGHSERCHEAWDKLGDYISGMSSQKMIKIDRYAEFKGRATDVDVVQDLMIHDIDLMLYLFSEKPKHVESVGHKIRTDKWDHVTSNFYYKNGDQVCITSGRNHIHEVRSLEIMSSEGCLFVDLFRNKISYGTNSKYEDGTFVKVEDYAKRDHLLIEQENFYNSIINKKSPMVTYKDGVNAVFYISKVLESLESGQRVTL